MRGIAYPLEPIIPKVSAMTFIILSQCRLCLSYQLSRIYFRSERGQDYRSFIHRYGIKAERFAIESGSAIKAVAWVGFLGYLFVALSLYGFQDAHLSPRERCYGIKVEFLRRDTYRRRYNWKRDRFSMNAA